MYHLLFVLVSIEFSLLFANTYNRHFFPRDFRDENPTVKRLRGRRGEREREREGGGPLLPLAQPLSRLAIAAHSGQR